MDSEAETDTSEQRSQTPSAPNSKKRARVARRDPNEDILPNWQRRPHVADRMPAPALARGYELNEGRTQLTVKGDGSTFAVGDYVFVAEQRPASAATLEDRGSTPRTFKVARIMAFSEARARVNWLARPSDVYFRGPDTRELFLTFQTAWIGCDSFRGKCTVQCRRDIRMLEKYREKPSQFWFSKLYHAPFARTYDVVPVAAMRSLDLHTVYELGLSATYAVLSPGTTKQLCEAARKRKTMEPPVEEAKADAELEEYRRQRSEWPFRYFHADSKEFAEPCSIPHTRRLGEQFQATIPDWPGRPLVYYAVASQNPNLRSGRGIRLVEPSKADPDEKVDTTKPWVQEMPRGYIPRGGESTSTPVSLPTHAVHSFVKECQKRFASSIEVHPSAVNFIDACCSVLVAHRDSVDDAFVVVSHLNRKQLREPDLRPEELATFKAELDPFAQNSWHHVFKAIGTKPLVELCQYYWVNLPLQASVSKTRMICDGQDPAPDANEDDDQFVCAVCKTDGAPEWKSLPEFLPLAVVPEYEGKIVAMCGRCARLWYRYQTKWSAPEVVQALQEHSELLEPELVEDTKTFVAERERRAKRRQAVQEKKEAAAKKREEAKRVKKVIKEAAKAGKPVASEQEALQLLEAADRSSSVVSEDGVASSSKPESSMSEKKSQSKPSQEDAKQPAPSKKSKPGPKRKKTDEKGSEEPAASVGDDDDSASSNVEEDDPAPAADKKNSTGSAGLISLDQVDELLAALEEPQAPENAQIPNFCAVCGQLDPSMPQETCASCGLKVHTACYGSGASQLASPASPLFWICDCCANSRGELAYDASYQCVMCPPRMPSYGSWLTGAASNAPDVLKNTMDKSWCHLRCAVWTPGVRFGNVTGYRDIDLAKVPEDLWNGSCAICESSPALPKLLSLPSALNSAAQAAAVPTQNSVSAVSSVSTPGTPLPDSSTLPTDLSSTPGTPVNAQAASVAGTPERTDAGNGTKAPPLPGSSLFRQAQALNTIDKRFSAAMGVKLKCELCDERFHVSCAADQGYQLGFTKDASPKPVIVCRKHMDTELTPMSKVDLNLSLSVMQKYVSACKLSKRRAMPVMDRVNKVRKQDHMMRKEGQAPPIQMVLPLNGEHIRKPFYAAPLKCRKCRKSTASYWHEVSAAKVGPQPDSAEHERSQDESQVSHSELPLVECPLCFRGLRLGENMHVPGEGDLRRLKGNFASRAYLELSK